MSDNTEFVPLKREGMPNSAGTIHFNFMNDVVGHMKEQWKTATDSEAGIRQRLVAGGELIAEGLLAAGAAYGSSRLGPVLGKGLNTVERAGVAASADKFAGFPDIKLVDSAKGDLTPLHPTVARENGYGNLAKFLESRVTPKSMDDLRPFWGKNLTIDETAFIHPSAFLHDDVTINAGAQIGPRTIIGPRAFIDKNVKLGKEVIVGEGVRIGEGTNFWGRSRIAPGVKLGNNITVPSGTNIDLSDPVFADGSHLL